jgi:hypothetical protein
MSKKRLLILLTTALLLMFMALPTSTMAAPPEAAEWTHVVNAWLGLRMRGGPSLTDPIVLVLFNGEDVRVKGDPIWAQGIRWSNLTVERKAGVFEGWVASAYLANYPGFEEPAGHFDGEGYKATASIGLRLRAQPGLHTKVLRIVPYGTVLEATETPARFVDGLWWQQLFLDGETVWASKQFLEQVR